MPAAKLKAVEVESTELVAQIKTPVVITGNFDEVKAYFAEELKKYDVVVTADTLADAKKLATELNKTATEVKKRGKAVTDEASAPIDAVKAQVKELAQMLLDGRAKLTEQIATFENETRALALQELTSFRAELWDSKGVDAEFRLAQVDDLVNLTAITAKGNLTAKSKAAVESRVSDDLHLQQRTRLRLSELKGKSYDAGLAAPLERAHVELFLFEADEVYNMRLASLLEAEALREAKAREAAEKRAADAEAARQRAEEHAEKRRIEQEQRHQQELEQMRQQQAAAPAQQQAQPEPQPVRSPISMDAVAVKHAFADIDVAPGTKPAYQFHVGTLAETVELATTGSATEIGVWTKESGLVAVILTGAAAQRYVAIKAQG